MDEIEIWEAASALSKSYGQKATMAAVNRATDFMARGNAPAAAKWARIASALEDLQRHAPREGEAIH